MSLEYSSSTFQPHLRRKYTPEDRSVRCLQQSQEQVRHFVVDAAKFWDVIR
jgi:hypothetical protein